MAKLGIITLVGANLPDTSKTDRALAREKRADAIVDVCMDVIESRLRVNTKEWSEFRTVLRRRVIEQLP